MSPTLILDLDNTIIDSEALASYRTARNWRACRSNAHKTTCFPSVREMVSGVQAAGIQVGVVTRSPSTYAEAMLHHHGIGYDALVAYHDTTHQKPHPEPVLLCLRRLEATVSGSLGVGDDPTDAQAYRAAGLKAWGAGWSPYLLKDGDWDLVVDDPEDVLRFFLD